MKIYDKTRLAVAEFGDTNYTTGQIKQALGGYLNTAQCLRELAINKEIEAAGKKGCAIIWHTIKLREVRKPRETTAKKACQAPGITKNTQASQSLSAALDAMTRNHQQGAAR